MNASDKTYHLYHSVLMSVPIVGSLLYQLQWWSLKTGGSRVYLARRNIHGGNQLLLFLRQHAGRVIWYSTKLVDVLQDFPKRQVVFAGLSGNPHDLLWSLVKSTHISYAAKQSLGAFVPSTIPVYYTVFIPMYERLDVMCDFTLQTAKTLSDTGHEVYIIPFENAQWVLKQHTQHVLDKRINVLSPINVFPKRLLRFNMVYRINEWVKLALIIRKMKQYQKPFLWCFHAEAIPLVIRLKHHVVVLYDCVDYFTTPDHAEETLARRADYMFVNSHVLQKRFLPIRPDVTVVPQGFDQQSMSGNLPVKQRQKIHRMFAHIPAPRVGYIGNLTNRLDFPLLFSVIPALPHISFIFIGDYLPMPGENSLQIITNIKRLRLFSNVYMIPAHPRVEVKEMLKHIDIGMIPYDVSQEFNRYSYPMKLFEYFYMGKPVISTPIEELKRFPMYVYMGKSAREWIGGIEKLSSYSWPDMNQKEQRKLAQENSWVQKIDKIFDRIHV